MRTTYATSRKGCSYGPYMKKIRPQPELKPACGLQELRMRSNACLAVPYNVRGSKGVSSSLHSPPPHSYSAQLPAATTRRPPFFAKAGSSSRLARTHSMFCDDSQNSPGTACHARCKRYSGRSLRRSSLEEPGVSKSSSCQEIPDDVGAAGLR